jgi:iron(III) transport system ATP-binding protein
LASSSFWGLIHCDGRRSDEGHFMAEVRLLDVGKYFGKHRVYENLNLTVQDSECFTLLGPSGCGKTVTVRLIAGFEQPTFGDLFIGKTLVSSTAKRIHLPPESRKIGIVFQDYAVWPHKTAFENVVYPLTIQQIQKNEASTRAERSLEQVALKGLENRLPYQLSGGQQQRVALARALVSRPEIMLLDEPLSNLDAKLRLEMRSEIRRIQKHLGITTVYVTHDQAEALSLADRIAVMNLGRISQLGSPREVYEYPENRFVAGFMGEANVFDGTIETIRKETGTSRVKIDDHLRIEGRLPKDFATYSIGDKVSCFIRLESVLGNEPCEQRLQAKILDTSYYGESERYELELPGKRILRVVRFNPTGRAFNPGETLEISLPAEKVIVLKE